MLKMAHNELDDIAKSLQGIWSDDIDKQFDATAYLLDLLWLWSDEGNDQTGELIEAGVLSRMVLFLQSHNHPELQSEAAHVLAYIASGKHIQMVADQGTISSFVGLLSSANQVARNQAILALGSISSVSSDYRDRVLAGGALSPLLAQFRNIPELTMQQNATNTLSELCRGTHTEFDVIGTLGVLLKLIDSKDEATLYYACRALYHLLEDDNGKKERIQALIGAGICPQLVQLVLHHPSNRVVIAALNTVGHIAELDDRQTQAIIDSRIIGRLVHHLKHSDTDTKMKLEAAQAISTTVERKSNQQMSLVTRYLVDEGFIQDFCEMLRSPVAEIVLYCLKILGHIFKTGEEVKVCEEDGTNPYAKKWTNPYAKKIQECGGFDTIVFISNGHGLPYSNLEVRVQATLIKLNYFPDH